MTFPEVSVNYWAVLACVVFNMVLGSLWYGPLFGKAWKKAMGLDPNMKPTPEQNKMAMKSMSGMVLTSFVTAWVLAYLVDYTVTTNWMEGAQTGLWIWAGFQATLMIEEVLFEKKKKELFLINGMFHLVSMLAMGAILASWI